MTVNTLATGTKVENQLVPPTLTGTVLGPVEGLPDFYFVEWSDGRVCEELVSEVTVIDEVPA